MGSYVEINDTLQLTTAQGFPVDVFDYNKHQENPVTMEDVAGKVFSFKDKPSARIFQLDPVRVYFVHNIEGRWLFWGRVLIHTQKIEKKIEIDGSWDGDSWITSGTYSILNIYDPKYQEEFTLKEAPVDRNYFRPTEINTYNYTNREVIAICELNAPAAEVWKLVGGFYNIHQWHPDITMSQVPDGQNEERDIRRELIFPGQPSTWEELVFMDNENMHYKYKWHKGRWGEIVQNYHADIQVIEIKVGETCIMKWSSTFFYNEDGLTQFYHNGFENLVKLFGGKY